MARCRTEIAAVEALLRAGHPDVQRLCLALSECSVELRILTRERERSCISDLDPGNQPDLRPDRRLRQPPEPGVAGGGPEELAELANRIIAQISGTYVRAGESHLREENLRAGLRLLLEDAQHSGGYYQPGAGGRQGRSDLTR